jgi:hypothetical protein
VIWTTAYIGLGYALAGSLGRFMPIGKTELEAAFCILMERLAADADPETNERTYRSAVRHLRGIRA